MLCRILSAIKWGAYENGFLILLYKYEITRMVCSSVCSHVISGIKLFNCDSSEELQQMELVKYI